MAGLAIITSDDRRAGLVQLARTARGYAEVGMAENTRRAYRSDWADFTSWCASVGAPSLPADAATLALYLTARAPTLAASTLARRLAAIRTAHREADHPAPASGDLRRIWSGIRRAHGRPPHKKRALVTDDLRRVVAKIPITMIGARDRAILLVGFAAALRRSELAAVSLDIDAPVRCVFVRQGLEIHIDRSKADQEGAGAIVGIPFGRTKLCPIAALRSWLESSGIRSGPVFRAVDRHGRLSKSALAPAAIAAVVKRCAARSGMAPDLFAGHSLRSGLITSAVGNGVATDVVMRQSRHARYDTMRGYIEEGDRFQRNAAAKVGL